MAKQQLEIVAPTEAHRAAWDVLYRDYAHFYEVEQTDEMRERVWTWLNDPTHEVKGLVAIDGSGHVVGLAHYRSYARPLAASVGGFLDDLFVAPAARGSGAAAGLIDAVVQIGRTRGWTVLRWITAEDNYRARGLYDRVATRTKWVTYDIRI
ncbi:GNAT family N-acetyltransferase [Segnochrobactrum spirostomi]|uniref:GNAT family N-acetyltransferase n=1 Tax=Segnochrobactrum spirostomi TaxID=2608987 RepID=A0A6A7Y6K9_9HYPH|nr:GNAT family N-acetyltransferase [Segnochrobactrum spirostomi]MQT14335.1 GNAT family N-acetyltransferase [Segnochrobactrum spirostomi]